MHKEAKRKELWVLDCKKQLPDMVKKTVISPLHYGDTLEIALIRGIEGETFIEGRRFEFEHENVFLIPPRQLHTSFYRKGGLGEGEMVCAFHINMEALAPFVDIKKILHADDRTLLSFPARCRDFEGVWALIQEILKEERLFSARLADLLRLFEIFSEQSQADTSVTDFHRSAIGIVDWIEECYADKVSVQHAADHFGFSKSYFCKWFKSNTGLTFNQFLNAVRINHACTHLINGCSVEDAALRSGYADPSYFIKVFKHFKGMTPRAYIEKS